MDDGRDVILRREVLNDGLGVGAGAGRVVRDEPELLATYIAGGHAVHVPAGRVPADGRHPWARPERWQGHGVLMLQRPGESHAIWVFWDGPDARVRRLVREPPGAVPPHAPTATTPRTSSSTSGSRRAGRGS